MPLEEEEAGGGMQGRADRVSKTKWKKMNKNTDCVPFLRSIMENNKRETGKCKEEGEKR